MIFLKKDVIKFLNKESLRYMIFADIFFNYLNKKNKMTQTFC